jgi:penicillin-binding protein 1B
MMQEVMHEGTGHAAYASFPKDYGLVGKTGTTNDAKDSWFAGYTGDYLSVVWVGRDDNKPIGLTGANGALPIWTALMQKISTQAVSLIAPDNVKLLWVDSETGLLTQDACGSSKQYPYISGSEPTAYSTCGQSVFDQDKPFFDEIHEDEPKHSESITQ